MRRLTRYGVIVAAGMIAAGCTAGSQSSSSSGSGSSNKAASNSSLTISNEVTGELEIELTSGRAMLIAHPDPLPTF